MAKEAEKRRQQQQLWLQQWQQQQQQQQLATATAEISTVQGPLILGSLPLGPGNVAQAGRGAPPPKYVDSKILEYVVR